MSVWNDVLGRLCSLLILPEDILKCRGVASGPAGGPAEGPQPPPHHCGPLGSSWALEEDGHGGAHTSSLCFLKLPIQLWSQPQCTDLQPPAGHLAQFCHL